MHDQPQGSDAERQGATELGEELRRACLELMADYGVRAWPYGDSMRTPQRGAPLAASAEFEGDHLRGSIAIFATRGVVERTARSLLGGECVSPELADWTCELVNQLLGRFKNKLRPFDVVVDVGMPRLMASNQVGQLESSARYRFSCDHGDFSGYLDVTLEPGFTFRKRELQEPLAWEGDVILF